MNFPQQKNKKINPISEEETKSSPKQILFGVQSFMMFIHACEQSGALSLNYSLEIKSNIKSLLKKINEESTKRVEALNNLNDLIERVNKSLAPFPSQNQYPLFYEGDLTIQVKNHILAFQNYLHEEVKCNQLDFNTEAPLFQHAFALWIGVASHKLTPKKGVGALTDLIQKTNLKLSEAQHYPLPDENSYDN